jgi:hypothetical protein
MAFQYLSSSTSIFNIVFNDILKISPALLSKYTSTSDQALYLILIPSVILLLFVWTFGYWITGSKARGIRTLISVIAYVYIVYSGFYGSFVAPVILAWFPITVVLYFIFFIMTKIFHPMNVVPASNVVSAVFKKATDKSKDIDSTERSIELLNKKISQLKAMQKEMENKNPPNDKAVAEIITKMTELEHHKMDLEDHLNRL